MEEFDYLDEAHTTEEIFFIVAEAGEYNLACDGAKLVVGTVSEMHESFV